MSRLRHCVLSLALVLSASAIAGCGGVRTGNPGQPNPKLAVELGPAPRTAISNLDFCITRLNFVSPRPGESVSADLSVGQVTVSSSGTPLALVSLPAGDYDRVEAEIKPTCDTGKSARMTNASGTFAITDTLKMSFRGGFTMNDSIRALSLDPSAIVAGLVGATAASQMTPILIVTAGALFPGPQHRVTWTGGGTDASWNNPANWSGGAVPTAMDVGYFDSSCGTRCAASIGASIEAYGIELASSFPGTVSQAPGASITLRYSGFVQGGGSFLGGNSDIELADFAPFYVTGGTFRSTSGTLIVTNQVTIGSGATFAANGGVIEFVEAYIQEYSFSPGGATFDTVLFHAGAGIFTTITGTLNATDVEIDLFRDIGRVTGGTIVLSGDLDIVRGAYGGSTVFRFAGSGPQRLNCLSGGVGTLEIDKPSGTLTISGACDSVTGLKYTSGTVDPSASTLKIQGPNDITIDSGSLALNHVKFAHTYRASTIVGTLIVNGDLTLDFGNANAGHIGGGTIAVKGNISAPNPGYIDSPSGTATILLNGTGNQTISAPRGNVTAGPLVIDKSSGTVTLATDLTLDYPGQDLTLVNGTLDMAGRSVSVDDTLTNGASCVINRGGGALSYSTLVNNGTINP